MYAFLVEERKGYAVACSAEHWTARSVRITLGGGSNPGNMCRQRMQIHIRSLNITRVSVAIVYILAEILKPSFDFYNGGQ
jgi:hypothetical protein